MNLGYEPMKVVIDIFLLNRVKKDSPCLGSDTNLVSVLQAGFSENLWRQGN